MATTRIHDLAAEFGISSEQLMGMLKELDIFVRSHLSPLKDEQVALMRARWEREKRKQREPAAPAKRRRGGAAASAVAGKGGGATAKAPEPAAPAVE
ncbi:MAG: translation initiation factor IF-2 N-terminal domain-containing protein, partial [Gemmatimonadales bacterium]